MYRKIFHAPVICLPFVSVIVLIFCSCDSPSGVNGTNRKPQITSISDIEIYSREKVSLIIQANDPDNDPVTFSIDNKPAYASLNNNSFIWQTLASDSGLHTVIFTASDGTDTSKASVKIKVIGSVDNVDSCSKMEILRPLQSQSFKIGDTMQIMWAIRKNPGIFRGVRVMLSPDNGIDYAVFNNESGFKDTDTSIYAGNIGLYSWIVSETAMNQNFHQISMIGDSCRIQILADYDVNACTDSSPLKENSRWPFRISGK